MAADVLKMLPWRHGQQAMCLLVMLSAPGAINGMIFTSSRISREMGADHRLFTQLGKTVFLVLGYAGTVAAWRRRESAWRWWRWSVSGFRDKMVLKRRQKCTAPVFWLFFLLTGLALIVLRFKDRNIERPFVSPAYPLPAPVFCFFCGFMLYGSVTYAPQEALVGIAILAVGVPLYLLCRQRPLVPGPSEAMTVLTTEGPTTRPTPV